jgi:hypothetical protein
MEEAMHIKTLIIVSAMFVATTAFAQNQNGQGAATGAATGVSPNTGHQQQPQTPGGQTNAQGEQPTAGKTMQEKSTSITNDDSGAKGAPGSTGTQSGTSPNGATK